jgi:chorismate-pyruvate lyase
MILAAALAAASVAPLPPDLWSRTQAEALVARLDATLLASRSATATLAEWCAAHDLAAEPRIRALVNHGAERSPTVEQRARLGIGADEPVVYRRVRLVCGDRVLSEAENWFVPARLSPAMVRALATTDTPFGTVIAPLAPSRRTVSDERLWQPLPAGWELSAPISAAGCTPLPEALFRHRALVLDGQGRPLAEVVETYRRDLLGFRSPWNRRAARHCRLRDWR